MNTQKFIEQTKTRGHETLAFELNKSKETSSFNTSTEIEGCSSKQGASSSHAEKRMMGKTDSLKWIETISLSSLLLVMTIILPIFN